MCIVHWCVMCVCVRAVTNAKCKLTTLVIVIRTEKSQFQMQHIRSSSERIYFLLQMRKVASLACKKICRIADTDGRMAIVLSMCCDMHTNAWSVRQSFEHQTLMKRLELRSNDKCMTQYFYHIHFEISSSELLYDTMRCQCCRQSS